jgi:hypothetical protein
MVTCHWCFWYWCWQDLLESDLITTTYNQLLLNLLEHYAATATVAVTKDPLPAGNFQLTV